ncbi:hypothetical protein TNCT_11291 [Trichonephila clavata]|uniref:Uncharacterized protein n=1 Tax=Trichonephila clavata TaxID=2740835 RepID=A0A8X6FRE0_TRICU|nr:hypothetical protein TNCT_11291 [Trichonephila clavata]
MQESFKFNEIYRKYKADDSNETPKSYLKELEPFKLPKKPDDEICPVSKLTTKKPTPYNRKKTTSSTTTTTTPDYSTTQKVGIGKKILSAFTRKKEEDNGYKFPKEASLDTYMNWKPAAGNWSSYGIHIEIPFTDVTFMKILVAEISLIVILVFSLQYYLMQMRSLRRNIDELMDRAHSRAISNFQVPENEVVDEDVQQTTPDDLTLLTSSTMIYSHLQELSEEIKNRNTGESSEKYLTKEFLQLVSLNTSWFIH